MKKARAVKNVVRSAGKTAKAPAFLRCHFFVVLGMITAVSLLLRGIVCWQLSATEAVVQPPAVTDMATYYRMAVDIMHGQWPLFYDYQPFYYAVFLPLVFCIFLTTKVWAVLVAQSLLGGVAVFLTGICGARMFGRKAGAVATLLLCICRFHIFYTPFMMLEVLQSFWMALILYFAISVADKNRLKNWCMLALVCAFSTLTRGNALLFMPGFIAFCVWRNRDNWKKAVWLSALVLVLFYLPQLPFSIRNYGCFGEWRGPSVAQNKVLALGNTPEAPPGGLEYPPSYHQWVAEADNPDPSLRVGILKNIGRWLSREPWAWPELKFRSVLLFWHAYEIPNNVAFEYHGKDSRLLQQIWLLDFSVIGALGLAGFCCLLGQFYKRKNILLFYMIGAYWAGTSGFYMLARFRIGVLPLLCVAGGFFVATLANDFARLHVCKSAAHRKNVLIHTGVLLLTIFIVNCAYGLYQEYIEVSVMKTMRPQGLCVDLPNSSTVYDHGPLVFGGCQVLALEVPVSLKKTFCVPDDFSDNAGTMQFRLWCRCSDAFARKIHVACGNEKLQFAGRDGDFLVWNIQNRLEDGQAVFNVMIPSSSPEMFILNVDFLRRYGRTTFNGNVIEGEAVAEIVCKY